MIKTIRAENIYNYVNAISGMTALATVFSMKPEENSTPTGSYIYTTIVSQIPRLKTQKGYITKTARVSFHIIAKKSLSGTDTPERVLGSIVDFITNNIVYQGCDKIEKIDSFYIQSILEDTVSPIFFDNGRYYMVKDYLFNYISVE